MRPDENSETQKEGSVKDPHMNEYLANERTFLAWIRTCLAVIGLGFVVARFSFWLNELALSTGTHLTIRQTGLSLPLGLGMIGLGGMLTILAAVQYQRVNRAIARGEVYSGQPLILLVTILLVVLAVILAGYLLVASGTI